jgi:hypothetical protein
MAKKIKDSLVNSSDIKMKQEKKEPKAKAVKVDQLHPKVKNKDSVTENIQSRSSKSAKDLGLGKSKKVPVSQKLNIPMKKKK